MNGLYIRVPDEKTYNEACRSAFLSPWHFRFPNGLFPKFDEMRECYHGNSKLLLRLFWNDITNMHEMQVTTATIEKSYPQIKNVRPVDLSDVDYDYMKKLFGERG